MVEGLLIGSVVILACILCSKISTRFGVPVLLAFIALGMICGCDGIVGIQFNDYSLADEISCVALLFIMFYGGFGTSWKAARPVVASSGVLTSLGTLLTAGLCGMFCFWVLQFDLLTSLLIGAVLSSTDAATVFSVLRSRRLNLKYGTASMLEIESGANDPFAYMLTLILISIREGQSSVGSVIWTVISQLAFGTLCGVAIAFGAVFILRHYQFQNSGNYSVFIFAVALMSYALPTVIGGNGFLSVYLTGLILGNSDIPDKKTLVPFFDGFTGLMQMLLFFLLGLVCTPSQMVSVIVPSILIALFLLLIARPLVVGLILTPFRCPWRQQVLVAWSGLRGAASIVFALVVLTSDASLVSSVFNIVFCVVLISIALQGSLLPMMAKKLAMIDDTGDVLKTFTDYSDETEVQFIQIKIGEEHPWANRPVKDVSTLPDTLLAMILRDGQTVVPKGDTVLQPGDVVVISAEGFSDGEHIRLSEITLNLSHEYCGKALKDCAFPRNALVVMIRTKDDQIIIPNGDVVVHSGDTLVINDRAL